MYCGRGGVGANDGKFGVLDSGSVGDVITLVLPALRLGGLTELVYLVGSSSLLPALAKSRSFRYIISAACASFAAS